MDLKEIPSNHRQRYRHPWETSRCDFFAKLLKKEAALGASPLKVLDVGAGDGFFAQAIWSELPPGSKALLWDMAYEDQFMQAHEKLGFKLTKTRPQDSFDLILLMDVLEHIEEERDFLKDVASHLLAERGKALISVPAWNILYTSHDKKLGHFRRYGHKLALDVIAQAGLKATIYGGLFHGLTLARAMQKIKEVILPPQKGGIEDLGDWSHGAFVSKSIEWGLKSENQLSYLFSKANISVPGLSFWALCEKERP